MQDVVRQVFLCWWCAVARVLPERPGRGDEGKNKLDVILWCKWYGSNSWHKYAVHLIHISTASCLFNKPDIIQNYHGLSKNHICPLWECLPFSIQIILSNGIYKCGLNRGVLSNGIYKGGLYRGVLLYTLLNGIYKRGLYIGVLLYTVKWYL